MSSITQCPQCSTRFKVTQAQLDAYQGMVRCGRCQAVFDAIQHLHDDQPSPQLDLPIMQEKHQQAHPATHEEFDFSHSGTAPTKTMEDAAPTTLAQRITIVEEPFKSSRKPAREKRSWPWAIGCLLLLIILLAQAAYFFRVELAARLPGLKPTLMSYCKLLKCSIPLPQKADQISIESSDMEADPSQADIIILNAILRNRAPYAQAYPSLELTLTDTQDKALARRTIRPAEYLKPDEEENQGLLPNREISVKLHLDTADLKPTGYRLFLFYPQ